MFLMHEHPYCCEHHLYELSHNVELIKKHNTQKVNDSF